MPRCRVFKLKDYSPNKFDVEVHARRVEKSPARNLYVFYDRHGREIVAQHSLERYLVDGEDVQECNIDDHSGRWLDDIVFPGSDNG